MRCANKTCDENWCVELTVEGLGKVKLCAWCAAKAIHNESNIKSKEDRDKAVTKVVVSKK